MNSVIASTGLSMFKLKTGCSPQMIPPLIPANLPDTLGASQDAAAATQFLEQMQLTEHKAKDNLLAAKVIQAFQADKHCGHQDCFQVSDWVMVTTVH
ncbi:reverse transcriptase-rnase h-integrase [Moniliophthora roreri MCA 2997]|uniref:Reverse transcriptase-rnase h-integrase n=1 Tax=Moniliophthora roreri (strain MCA 2997) TaxID=1381753 RepID=V2W5V1_MONRO|nr:reverse transcriptase-rnase h-integrase [Moniliophthora roreri MCA 2997]